MLVAAIKNKNNDLLKNVLLKNIFINKSSAPVKKIDTLKLFIEKIAAKKAMLSEKRSLTKYKNFCLFSGRGRTYNRILFIARHHVRKLINIGALAGVSK